MFSHLRVVVPQSFDSEPHLALLREMLRQVFATPVKHAKSKPFFDHVMSFHVADGRVWIRNYQARSRFWMQFEQSRRLSNLGS